MRNRGSFERVSFLFTPWAGSTFLDEILKLDSNWSIGRFAINPSVYTYFMFSYFEVLLYVIYPARLRRNK